MGFVEEAGEEPAIRVPPRGRILATLNVFDKNLLFEMSYALMRRFAFVGCLGRAARTIYDVDLRGPTVLCVGGASPVGGKIGIRSRHPVGARVSPPADVDRTGIGRRIRGGRTIGNGPVVAVRAVHGSRVRGR